MATARAVARGGNAELMPPIRLEEPLTEWILTPDLLQRPIRAPLVTPVRMKGSAASPGSGSHHPRPCRSNTAY